ncbi:hypothetical protein CROQUDRAFT_92936 [Cronartium quercuum f. sp. fusiforme G11]|uniref:Uncharacterized protein n=1 Tax=Cronartium quercuum f. sp. fusiforme G11 TaxID=708437 RepID=A0A9P6TBE6_9BASI|nr:hypothetical protein CROQUDRAFT_92936 [Cronartium quercuum f. sp. fusiforme G11]
MGLPIICLEAIAISEWQKVGIHYVFRYDPMPSLCARYQIRCVRCLGKRTQACGDLSLHPSIYFPDRAHACGTARFNCTLSDFMRRGSQSQSMDEIPASLDCRVSSFAGLTQRSMTSRVAKSVRKWFKCCLSITRAHMTSLHRSVETDLVMAPTPPDPCHTQAVNLPLRVDSWRFWSSFLDSSSVHAPTVIVDPKPDFYSGRPDDLMQKLLHVSEIRSFPFYRVSPVTSQLPTPACYVYEV